MNPGKVLNIPKTDIDINLADGDAYISLGEDINLNNVYVDIEQDPPALVEFPPKPHRLSRWDWQTKAYAEDTSEIIALCRSEAERNIDRIAGQARLNYFTEAPGQQATYLSKLDDAKAYIAAGYPEDASPYKWVKAEVDATGATAAEVADLIVTTAAQWEEVGAAIEGARQAAKRVLKLAEDIESINAAEESFKGAIQEFLE
ncbi:hypothetical protein [Methylotuvimicrobium sp. KM2]|uniref:hypothetical protein n=1 Tax=Methylotuvimicrobium sp. KM2 TaxID=3133976 RepID=UPI003101AD88